VLLALPAAYAFSRYSFLGDKHLFFWLLTNRMTPPAVFLLPFFQLYSTFGMMDTHIAVALAHLLFNVPLAVWILEGFMSGIPKEIDETAYIDGYSFPAFFVKIFLPLIKSGIGVTAFFCFMFSWVELLLARTLTSVNAKVLPWGGCDMGNAFSWMAWTLEVAVFFISVVLMLIGMTIWQVRSPSIERKGFLPISTTRGDRLFIGLLSAAYVNLAWAGLTDLTQWVAAVIGFVVLLVMMRWG